MDNIIYYSDEKTVITQTQIKERAKRTMILENGVEVYTKPEKGNYYRTDGKRGYAFMDQEKYEAYIAHTRLHRYISQISQELQKIDKMDIPESKRRFLIKSYRKLERICGKL